MFIWSPVEFSPPIKFIGSAVAIDVIIAASASAVKVVIPQKVIMLEICGGGGKFCPPGG